MRPVAVLEVVRAGPLTTVQDQGRVGLAHLGVPRAGALDAPAAALANRLVGNDPGAAVLETTLGGLVVRPSVGAWVAVTGAGQVHPAARWLAEGERLVVETPTSGVRAYLAVAGGVDVPPVLGSRSTDTLAWVGPPQVRDGDELPLGVRRGAPRPMDAPRPPSAGPLRLHPGPHPEVFAPDAVHAVCQSSWTVREESNRVGLRLEGPPVGRRGDDELPSEGMVLGAVQVPPDGQPVVLLADHPTTGGYPVVGVVDPRDLWRCAQVRPGETVAFAPVRGA